MVCINFLLAAAVDAALTRRRAEKNRDKLARDGAIPLLIKSIASSNDFTLKLACAATLWNLSVNGAPFPSPLYLWILHRAPQRVS